MNSVIRKIEKEYGQHRFGGFSADGSELGGSVTRQEASILYSLVICTVPLNVLEIGSGYGYSTLWIAQAVRDTDIERYAEPKMVSIEKDSGRMDIARSHLEEAGLDFVHFTDNRNTGKKFDFVFVDADHTIPGCLADWRYVEGVVKPGSIVVFHDTVNPHVMHVMETEVNPNVVIQTSLGLAVKVI